ncbi:TPA: type VI secretion system ATPase TssH [Pseudomonas putida]|uniref:type VI secretion system ATPase TssH n=1 Tax=Pseudomonas TaxID=286 RepID=UPI00047FBC7B|nr:MULTISPECIES: type VI secretion system ATPase TssH [Pseudomonas]MDD2154142.1 type VI secretion system ATPase TssH [Pseudomonas putida]RAS28706.1 type VI secretion system protein VasG [Pseudomonas sp. URMO17WK12:I7]SMF20429.1 type VI secretion system protein VasG [Pseudomonas sp. URMO17WK12:I5]HDS1682356.1 type VI secretion system ATPase TssH [Pseudomonas putida]
MNLKSLFAKLNDTCRGATESAAALCLAERHYEVDIEHVLLQLLEGDDNDLRPVLRHYDVVVERLQSQLADALQGFKTGNTRTPALSPHITQLIERAWVLASIEYGTGQIRSGYLLLALLDDADLRRLLLASAAELDKINVDDLRANLPALISASGEAQQATALPADTSGPAPLRGAGKTPALDQYTVDLTRNAREGRIDPVLGREFEVRQMVDILTRRRQNNPILTGEAGVGKTAVVEGLALRIAEGDVPEPLKGVAIHTLDLGLLQAGAGIKGEFENRLKAVIEETKRSVHPIILFIDEAHTLIGSGGQAGQNDAANLLKPALARGELRTIAATTWAEYKKYFEKDAALARRFQVVKVEEPEEDQAIYMLRGLLEKMQSHHRVAVMDDALVQAVRLSSRYITGRQLPDKAVSVLDTACARVALGQTSQPGRLEDCLRLVDNLRTEIDLLEQEQSKGSDHQRRLGQLHEQIEQAGLRQQRLEQQWQRELELVKQIHALSDASDSDNRAALAELRVQLADVQGEEPLVHALVDGATIGEVISGWTGIPLGKMLRDEIDTVQRLPALMAERVLGQDHALHEIGKRIKISRARMEDPNKPIGVFLLLGPSGVGKTETALALADTLYGGERNVITINMSEYQEAHTVSSLKGSPPGYVGYGEGGVLTEAVRRKPYSVVLLDEVEKAHPDVLELFFQVFDKGVLDDGEGREINFRNTVIILTSNVGTEHIMRTCLGAEQVPAPAQLVEDLRDQLNSVFKPAFLGRLSIVPYYPVQDAILERIVGLKLERIRQRFERNHQAQLHFSPALVPAIAARCTEVDSGARNIDNILSGSLMPELAEQVLARMAEDQPINSLRIDLDETGGFTYSLA